MIQSASPRPQNVPRNSWNPLRWVRREAVPESIFFYTFHKCASTLFSSYVLKNIQGLEHIDYAQQVFQGETVDLSRYERRGCAYGPIRLSFNALTDMKRYDSLVGPVIQRRFVRKRIALLLVRDPRDIAISSYYSFGFSHNLSSVEELRLKQLEQRRQIRAMSLDEYVIAEMPWIIRGFETAENLLDHCPRATLLRYEDMIHNWERFAEELTAYIQFDEGVLNAIYRRSRPREEEDITAHRRSGQTDAFRAKLKPETIRDVNETLTPVFERFGYQP